MNDVTEFEDIPRPRSPMSWDASRSWISAFAHCGPRSGESPPGVHRTVPSG
ncbi:hypothetical protein ACFQX6_39505 [Streptosporangium lutulentum]